MEAHAEGRKEIPYLEITGGHWGGVRGGGLGLEFVAKTAERKCIRLPHGHGGVRYIGYG